MAKVKAQLQEIKAAILKENHESVKILTTNIDPNLLTELLASSVKGLYSECETLLHCAARHGCISDISVLTEIKPEKFLLKDHRGESVLKHVAVHHHSSDIKIISPFVTSELLLSTSICKDINGAHALRTVLFQAGSEGWFHDLKDVAYLWHDWAPLVMRANTLEPFLISAVKQGWIQEVTSKVKIYPEMLTMYDGHDQKFLNVAIADKVMLEQAGSELLSMITVEMLIDPAQVHNSLFKQVFANENIKYFSHLFNCNTLIKIAQSNLSLDSTCLNTMLKDYKLSEIKKFMDIPLYQEPFYLSDNFPLWGHVSAFINNKFTLSNKTPKLEQLDNKNLIKIIEVQLESEDLVLGEWSIDQIDAIELVGVTDNL